MNFTPVEIILITNIIGLMTAFGCLLSAVAPREPLLREKLIVEWGILFLKGCLVTWVVWCLSLGLSGSMRQAKCPSFNGSVVQGSHPSPLLRTPKAKESIIGARTSHV